MPFRAAVAAFRWSLIFLSSQEVEAEAKAIIQAQPTLDTEQAAAEAQVVINSFLENLSPPALRTQ